jgi:hypothetical protein
MSDVTATSVDTPHFADTAVKYWRKEEIRYMILVGKYFRKLWLAKRRDGRLTITWILRKLGVWLRIVSDNWLYFKGTESFSSTAGMLRPFFFGGHLTTLSVAKLYSVKW